ncbi:hypothetical protein KY284_008037 [Solanum tuberosum]|nr:hypothetical protein KY284_008037 [Solanum tuberosum]
MFMESASLNASSSGKKSTESAAFNTNGSGGAGPSRSTRPNHSPTGNTNTNFKTNYSQTSSYSGNRPHMAPSMKRPLVIGEAKDGLYFLCSKCLMKPVHSGAACTASAASNSDYLSRQDVLNSKLVSFPIHSSPATYHSPNSVQQSEPIIPKRPPRSHRLPAYLHDYVLPNNVTNQLQNSHISLNTAFSKHQHIPSEILAFESHTLVRNISNNDEPSSYEEAAINPAWQQAMT